MPHNEKKLHESPAKRFVQLLGLIMLAVYFILGIKIIFWNDFFLFLDISRNYRILFGILLIAYSIFRGVRLVQNRND